MAAKKKTQARHQQSLKYFTGIKASQERVKYIVGKNTTRDNWEQQHKYRKYQD